MSDEKRDKKKDRQDHSVVYDCTACTDCDSDRSSHVCDVRAGFRD